MFSQVSDVPFCNSCALGKSHRMPYQGHFPKAQYPGHTVHCDLSGKITPSSDIEKTKNYLEMVGRVQKKILKVIVNDNGGKYISEEYQSLIKKHCIIMEPTSQYLPQQNSFSEGGNHSTSERTSSLLFTSKLSTNNWGEVISL
ncbi:hypothetical protein O181_069367 [Austropuccinia psidii MF-1]|uniref:Integrase catalytic domain-containing protein n=1 Tax=Austropuccinia psidii MF-1 TaxID=1389203 RepID=A0A9Q3F453_9BASI|nr:hypothetical protein [Austropuccinia psidii MF-1]